jgi:hypothetical protein
MEGHPAIHKDEIKELDPVHQSYVTKRKGDSYIFEWEVEITDPVLQATSPLVRFICFQLFVFLSMILCWLLYHASRLC